MKVKKQNSGITLIALVITIIVLLILAGVTIATLTGNNGILTQANKAKDATAIGEEKEIIGLSIVQAKAFNENGQLEKDSFQEALNQNCKSSNKANIINEDIQCYTVKFESNRYYEVDKNGNVSYIENVTGEKTLTIQCVNSNDEILQESKYTIVTDRYSKMSPEIDGYEAENNKIEGDIKGDITVKALYYLIANDDSTLVFNGVDVDGNITTIESSIVGYMIGDKTTTEGNGMKEKSIKSVVKIPDRYKGKGVILIGNNAFARLKNIIKVYISDNVVNIGGGAFSGSSIEQVTIGKKVESIGANPFWGCGKLKTVKINSSVVANSTNNYGYLLEGRESIYIKNDIVEIGSYINSNYVLTTSDEEGYLKYVKK